MKAHCAGKMRPEVPVLPKMETAASDGIYTIAAGLPSYGINGAPLVPMIFAHAAKMNSFGWTRFVTGLIFTTIS